MRNLYVKNADKVFDKQDVFKCYSLNLAKFLCDKEIVYIKRGVNTFTNKVFYIFLKTDELCEALEYWKNNNPNK